MAFHHRNTVKQLSCLIALAVPILSVFMGRGAPSDGDWVYLDNEKIRLGVNRSAGAAIGWFSESGEGSANVLNAYDLGRYVQQSWYGATDDSDWNGQPWRWNPVQAGGWRGEKATVTAFEADASIHSLTATTAPRHWASGELLEEVTFEQSIRLNGAVAEIRYRMRYRGMTSHPAHHQELPAVFVNPQFSTLVFQKAGESKGTTVTRVTPGWPNEYHQISGGWVAYVDESKGDQGIGILVPGITDITCYRFGGDSESACSYVAPIRTMAVTPGFEFEYRVYLTLGTLTEIQKRFEDLGDTAVASDR